MDEQELQEFTLDEIMKEFSDREEPGREQTVPSDTIRIDPEQITEDAAQADVKPVPSDTIRVDREELAAALEEKPVTGDTIRLDQNLIAQGQVRCAQPVEEEEPEGEEPYSEGWEPEYEQPMGDYVPAPQIIVHPRSRLRELKRKLVAGPEKRYYELSEVGVWRLQIAMVFSFLVVLISVGASALYGVGLLPESRLKLMVFGQLFLMLVSALLGTFQLIEGGADLFKGKFSLNTLLVFTFIACCADAILCLQQVRVPCCAAFSLEIFMSLWSDYHRRSGEMGMMDTMRKAVRLDKLCAVEGYYEGRKGFLRAEGQVEDFMDTCHMPSQPEKTLNWYALAALAVSAALGAAAFVLEGLAAGLQVTAVSLLAAAPATIFITLTRPFAVLEKRLHKVGTVLCGWQGVRGLSGKACFPISHGDLFPAGYAKMNGVKFFGDRETDEIVAYCTALVEADGGGLAPVFAQVLESRNGRHYSVEDLENHDGGLSGTVQGEPVLVGTLSFLKSREVEVPEGIRVHQAVCVAISGELCGLFAVSYEKPKPTVQAMLSLWSSRKLRTVLAQGDFMLTESFLKNKLGITPRRFDIPERAVCQELAEKAIPEDAPALLLTTQEGILPLACGVTGARALRTASRLGTILHMAGGILGMAIVAILTLKGARDLLTPMNMFLYQFVWVIPGLLLSSWTKTL